MPHVDTPQSHCRFGIARCDITPPVGIYHRMWGAATHERATGIHRPLTASAACFQALTGTPGPASEQVLVAVDHCLLWHIEMQALTQTLCQLTGLVPEQLSVAFSHTHAAGLMGRERSHLPGGELIGPYLDRLGNDIAGIVKRARESARPAGILYGAGRCNLAAHRDFWDDVSGQWICGFNPGGDADDTVLVARVSADDGKPLATFVNYACHPTTLAWENTLISPDFPGAMREVVEAATAVPCVFLQGASGELGPREGFVGDPAVADRNGRQLGHAALAALEALPVPGTRFEYVGPVVSGATLGEWKHRPLSAPERQAKACWRVRRWTLDLPYRAGLPTAAGTRSERERWLKEETDAQRAGRADAARDAHAMVERMDRQLNRLAVLPEGSTYPLEMALWQLGDAFWLAVESEHYQLLQRSLRRQIPEVPIVVMTIVNGSRAAYLPPAEIYGKGIYQETIALLAPGSLEQVIDAAAHQIRTWLASESTNVY
jgi:hypothetical protein